MFRSLMIYIALLVLDINFYSVEAFELNNQFVETELSNSNQEEFNSRLEKSIEMIEVDFSQNNQSQTVLNQVKNYLDELGVESLSELGTLNLSETNLDPGIYILSKNCSSQSVSHFSNTNILNRIGISDSSLNLNVKCTSLIGTYNNSETEYNVVHFSGDEFIDKSYIIADKIIFSNTTLTLSESISDFYIIAQELESTNATITWEHNSTALESESKASRGADGMTKSGECAEFNDDSCDGDNGKNGASGNAGQDGRNAPNVTFIVKNINAKSNSTGIELPSLNLKGQSGAKGQDGGDGGNGGDGADGLSSITHLVNCHQGPGFGGDGGDGGDGGNGGKGGNGGNGGSVSIYYVTYNQEIQDLNDAKYTNRLSLTNGVQGIGGLGGSKGNGGEAGYAGEAKWPCQEEPERDGDDGVTGTGGEQGSNGRNGSVGIYLGSTQISESTWEEYLTKPYIESLSQSSIAPNESVTINTLNISGEAIANLKHSQSGKEYNITLDKLNDNSYLLNETYQLTDGRYEVTIINESDIESINFVNLEVIYENIIIQSRQWDKPFRLGFNAIRLSDMRSPDSNEKELDTIEEIIEDIYALGGGGIRHAQGNDISWFSTYNGLGAENPENYNFQATDEIKDNNLGVYFIPTLFFQGPNSQARYFGYNTENEEEDNCPDVGLKWHAPLACRYPRHPDAMLTNKDKDILYATHKDVQPKVEGYVEAVANYFKESGIKHFEVGNEWERFPHRMQINEINLFGESIMITDWRWDPKDFVELMEVSRDKLREIDSENKVVLGGLFSSPDTDLEESWFRYILNNVDSENPAFDIVSFHFYEDWRTMKEKVNFYKNELNSKSMFNTPLWLTEVGTSATIKSEEEQIDYMIKSLTTAFGNGVEVGMWHTHMNSHDGANGWGGYGVRPKNKLNLNDDDPANDRDKYLSYYAYQMYANKIGNFETVTCLSEGEREDFYAYKFSGSLHSERGELSDKIIAWIDDDREILDLGQFLPDGVSEITITSFIPDESGNFERFTTDDFDNITLYETPVLIEWE